MPKTIIDYSNTIIYKITCKDASITDVYVGHTTNFVQRKHAHKQSCTNEKSSSYNCKLYKIIRVNGGWDNWLMEIVAFYKCYDHYEARMKEQEYFTLLNATLNSIEPLPKPKPKELPLKKCSNIGDGFPQKIPKFGCDCCQYSTSSKKDYGKHELTHKHMVLTLANTNTSVDNCIKNKKKYICNICNKNYDSRNGLWKHKKICKTPPIVFDKETNNTFILDNEPNDKALIMMILKQNQEIVKQNSEFKNQIMEVVKNGIHNPISY